jgi:hypothetical protein
VVRSTSVAGYSADVYEKIARVPSGEMPESKVRFSTFRVCHLHELCLEVTS